MREHLYRGKRVDNGEWVQGYFAETEGDGGEYYNAIIFTSLNAMGEAADMNEIIYHEAYIVNPETVEQYTGLTDKNGNKIFEGDILLQKTTEKFKSFNPCVWEKKFVVEFGYHEVKSDWKDGVALGWFLRDISTNYSQAIGDLEKDNDDDFYPYEVIGNKWDNPELLEAK